INRSAELLAVSTGMRDNRVAAESDLMAPPGGRQSVVDLILPVHQQRRLRSAAREGAACGDWHLVLRARDHRVELRDRRGKLELEAQTVEQGGTQDGCLAYFFRVRAAPKDPIDGWKIVAADRAVRVRVVKTIEGAAEKHRVLIVDLVVQAKERQPAAVVSDEDAWRDGRTYG